MKRLALVLAASSILAACAVAGCGDSSSETEQGAAGAPQSDAGKDSGKDSGKGGSSGAAGSGGQSDDAGTDSGNDGSAGSSGSAGNGGSSGAGGSAGTGGSDAGAAGTGGTAGSAGKGGSDAGAGDAGGAGGSAGSGGKGGSDAGAGGSGGDAGTYICNPNPCLTSENQASHKTKCTPDTSDPKGYVCSCSFLDGYHDSNGICCQAYSDNVGGKCVCKTGYVDPNNTGKCVPVCNEDTFEGLQGWCATGKVCVQGVCQVDGCSNYSCPTLSTCVSKNGAGFCQCNSGLHMDNSLCCKSHASNVGGACVCDPGYKLSSGSCVAESTNKCAGANPCKDSYKNVCIPDNTAQGYHCECNENFQLVDGKCQQIKLSTCPSGTTCQYGYCAAVGNPLDQCLTDADCKIFYPQAGTTCNPAAPGGVCVACTSPDECPGNTQCYKGACSSLCSSDKDCPYGVCSTYSGQCMQKTCTSNEDCFGGTICIQSSIGSEPMCQRPRCTSTECGTTNPNGTCPNANESCIAAKCVNSCTPNPCTGINQKCAVSGGKPVCECVAGTAVDSSGKCAPITVSQCPSGFACESGRCVDDSVNKFQCGSHSDCGTGMSCSNALPAGICYGCNAGFKCPAGSTCLSDYCLSSCVKDADCATGMVCKAGGRCGSKDCSSPSDCPANYTCSTSGSCHRIPCK